MKVEREALNEVLRNIIPFLEERQPLYLQLEEKYNIPFSITADVCSNRKDVGEINDFIAFALLEATKPKRLNEFFTDEEIKAFSSSKYEKPDKIEDEVVFDNMIQIADDQWIGRISAKYLMQLKDSQLIKYNENTQRTLQSIVRGEKRSFKIALNKSAIREIKEAFENGSYIPDDITLNVDVDIDEYNPKKKTLIFSPPKMMDILDGYHRYIAMSQAIRENPDLDFPMEIRVVSFSEEKAKQFIYQKDQKTRMKSIESKSMNQYSPSNQVVEALNTNASSNIQGMINRNDGKINFSYLSSVIETYYFGDKRKKYTKKQVIEVISDLQRKFNDFTTNDISWLDHNYTEREIQVIIFCFANDVSDNETINRMLKETEQMKTNVFTISVSGKTRKPLINELTNILERIRRDV